MRKPRPITGIANLKHGITARTLAVTGLEDHTDWLRFREAIIESLNPEGELELELATVVAEGLWRRRRVSAHELNLIEVERQRRSAKDGWEGQKKHAEEADGDQQAEQSEESRDAAIRRIARTVLGDAVMGMQIDRQFLPDPMLPAKTDLERIMRYEAHLTRQIYHALHELQALQAIRRGQHAPLARLSVLGGA